MLKFSKYVHLLMLMVILFISVCPINVFSSSPIDGSYERNEIVVGMKNTTTIDFFYETFPDLRILNVRDVNKEVRDLHSELPIDRLDEIVPLGKVFLLTIESISNDAVPNAIDLLIKNENIRYAEPNYIEMPNAFDLTGDIIVNLNDVTFALQYMLVQVGDPNWDEAKVADVSGDGIVNIDDIVLILANYTVPYY